jgi:hypothetical protein
MKAIIAAIAAAAVTVLAPLISAVVLVAGIVSAPPAHAGCTSNRRRSISMTLMGIRFPHPTFRTCRKTT